MGKIWHYFTPTRFMKPDSQCEAFKPCVGYGDGVNSCEADRNALGCLQRRSLRYEPVPNYVAPNSCCDSVPFNNELKCCCDGIIFKIEDCPCMAADYSRIR